MLWIKAFHVIAVICWFAAAFYLPRLFVYHAMSDDEISKERFKLMEHKLYKGIMTPALIAMLVLGIWMSALQWEYYSSAGWYHAKMSIVVLLVAFHFYCAHIKTQFSEDKNTKSHVFFRVLNELPVFALFAIVILAVVKPF